MAKMISTKKNKTEGIVVEKKVLAQPKIHLTKYFVLHSMTVMQKAFLTASSFRDEMHTEDEWEKIINSALTRKVK